MPLPAEVQEVVDRTVAAARLTRRERATVRAELECHFHDGLELGIPATELIATFGDPELAARLIGRAKRRSRGHATAAFAVAAASVAVCYVVAVMLLHTAPPSDMGSGLDREAQRVADLVARAQSRLDSPPGVWESYAIAVNLRRSRSLWSEPASIVLLDELSAAADSLLAPPERTKLADSLRMVDATESLLPRQAVVRATITSLVSRLYGRDGRIDRAGLRLLQRTKGVASPSLSALLLEPLYFARPVSRRDLERMVQFIVTNRVARATAAGQRLKSRLSETTPPA